MITPNSKLARLTLDNSQLPGPSNWKLPYQYADEMIIKLGKTSHISSE